MRLQLTSLAMAAVLVAAQVRADSSTDSWNFELEGRGNYYWERSTRVIVPTVQLRAVAPDDTRVDVGYLVDVIASASIAQTGSDRDAVFTELRHGVALGVGRTFALRESDLDLYVHGAYSTENDYESRSYGLDVAYSWNDKNTTVQLGVTRVDDTIRSNADRTFEGELEGITTYARLSQVVSPVVLLGVGYQLGYLEGFLSNAYRRALIGPLPYPEAHPGERFRHNVDAHLGIFIPDSDTSLHLYYRAYIDSWDIAALTPELRLIHEFSEDVLVRLRYRYYTQTSSYFYMPRYPAGYVGPVTNDPKMAAFLSHRTGISFQLRTAFLADSVFDFAKDAWLDIGFDYTASTSSFGDNVMGTVGGRIPF